MPKKIKYTHNYEAGHDRIETDYEPWFAWRPVMIDDKLIWLQTVLRKEIHYVKPCQEIPIIINLYKFKE